MEDNKAKELKKSPFNLKLKYDNEKEFFCKIIDKIKKNVVLSEQDKELRSEFEKALKDTKSPIQMHVRGTALLELGYEFGNEFISKAADNGFAITESIINEGIYKKPYFKYFEQIFNLFTNKPVSQDILMSYLEGDHLPMQDFISYNLKPDLKWMTAIGVLDAADSIVIGAYENGLIKEGAKQETIYDPNEERIAMLKKWNVFEDEDAPKFKAPKYNRLALRHMIEDDAFLKFSFHNLATGDDEKDLDLIFDTYVEKDQMYLQKMKTYESHSNRMLENKKSKSPISLFIENVYRNFGAGFDQEFEGVETIAITKIAARINETTMAAQDEFALYTPEIKNELKGAFVGSGVESFVKTLAESGIKYGDIMAYVKKIRDEDKLIEAFGISKGAANYVNSILSVILPIVTESYAGGNAASILFAIGSGILLKKGLGQNLNK
jgi:hypothetical protein